MKRMFCLGRQYFEDLVPFGSERNKCPLGLGVECVQCRFYGHEDGHGKEEVHV